ncbi:MAG TPA: hypothetical protein DEF05_07525 [Erwinia sp.]|nr:hypothetical protein [Erwinia sp.]
MPEFLLRLARFSAQTPFFRIDLTADAAGNMNIALSADFAHDDTGIRTVVVFTGTLAAEDTVAAEKLSSNSLSVSRAEA